MCSINKDGSPCKFEIRLKHFDISTECDAKKHCIFHSSDMEWKNTAGFETIMLHLTKNEIEEGKLKNLDFKGAVFDNSISKLLELDWQNRNLVLDDCFIDANIQVEGVKWHGSVSFENTTINGKVSLKRSELNGVNFQSSTIKGDLFLTDVRSKSYFYLNKTNIYGSISMTKVTFEHILSINDSEINSDSSHVRHTKINNCDFMRMVEFQNTKINKAFVLTDSRIYDRFSFQNTYFHCDFLSPIYSAVFIANNTILDKAIVSFKGSHEVKLFEQSSEVIISKNETKGEMLFEYCNLLKIKNSDRQLLIEDSRNTESGVVIGAGCLKYRLQSPVKIIRANSNTEGIIQELSHSFSNYFISSNGFNLGVEFVSKEMHEIKLFYYSDENITLEEFNRRLIITEQDYWALSVEENALVDKKQVIGLIDAYISKLSILSKIKLRKEYGMWNESNIKEILSALDFGDNLLDTASINIHIEKLQIDSGIRIENQVNHGGSHQFADEIYNNDSNDDNR